MIRHSKSLFISILIHIILILLLILVYQNWPESKKEEKRVCLKMCHVLEHKDVVQKPQVIPPPKKKEKPKVYTMYWIS